MNIIIPCISKKVNKVKKLAARDKYTYVFYGSLENATYLEQLYYINQACDEEKYDISKVYLFYNDFILEAKKNGDDDTKVFKDKINGYEDKINAKVNDDSTDFDMTVTDKPTLLVFKNGELLFNTQQDEDSKYNWTAYIIKAFSFENVDRLNEKN